jgi:hypothetical protein
MNLTRPALPRLFLRADYAILQHIVRFHGPSLANLTLFCEAGVPRMCSPHTVVRPVGLSSSWPVPFEPHEAFAPNPPHTFSHVMHHMDLASFSSRWWGNCSYGYQSSPKRRFPFVRTPFANYGAWLRHMVGEALATDLLSNPRGYLVFGGYFAVEKANLRRYPRELYEALARQQRAPNEEVDHYIERTWCAMRMAKTEGILRLTLRPLHPLHPTRLRRLRPCFAAARTGGYCSQQTRLGPTSPAVSQSRSGRPSWSTWRLSHANCPPSAASRQT